MVVGQEDFSGIVEYLNANGVTIREGPVARWGARGRATSVYFLDPDGHKLEIHAGDWRTRLAAMKAHPWDVDIQYFD